VSYHKVIGRLQESVNSLAGDKDSEIMTQVKNIVGQHQHLCDVAKVFDFF
jgi:hypothetical protein